MLGAWPVLCAFFFARLPAPKALLWSVLGGYLLLPSIVGIDLPGLPDIDKTVAVDLAALYALIIYAKRGRNRDGEKLYVLLGIVLVVAPFMTARTNPDPISFGPIYINGLTYYDGLSMAAAKVLMIAVFWAGRRFLGSEEGHIAILKAILASALVYSVFVLFEIRFSPQLHGWVYGYKPFSFIQQARYGGYRGVVFLNQGLQVALLLGQAILAALVLRRNPKPVFGVPYGFAILYLIVVILVQKSLGAVILTTLLGVAVLFISPRRQITTSVIAALLVVTYPALRSSEVGLLDNIGSFTGVVDKSREQSFNFRLKNETMLLERAEERPFFGWGGWNRNQPHDQKYGRVISVLDGAWIITFSENGWVGYLAVFGLLSIPLIRLSRARWRGVPLSPYTAGLAIVLAINLLDLIPNYSLSPVTWMIAGALSSMGARSKKPVKPDSENPGPDAPIAPAPLAGVA